MPPPDVGVQAGQSLMVPLPRPLATASKFNSGSPVPPVMVKCPSKVTTVEVDDEGGIERPMRVVTAVVPPQPVQSAETPELSMPPRKRADSTSSTRSHSSAANSTPARVTPSPNLRGIQPSPNPRGKQSPVSPNPRIKPKPTTPAPVSRSQTEPKLPSIAEKPLPRATRGINADEGDFPDLTADPAVAALLARFRESQAKAAEEIRAKSPEAARAKSPTTTRAMSPETVRAKSPETTRARSPTARGNDLRFRSFSEAQIVSTPSPAPAAAGARRMHSPIPPSTSLASSGWRRAGTPAGAASGPSLAASRTVSSKPAFPASKPGLTTMTNAPASAKSPSPREARQAELAKQAEQNRIEAEQKAAEKRRLEEEKERELEVRMMAMREEQRKREEEAETARLQAEEEERQRVAAEEERKRKESEARAEEERRMQALWASKAKGKQPQTATRADPKGNKQRAVDVEDSEMSPPARGRVKVDHEFALRLQAEELARAQAAANQALAVNGNTIQAPTAILPSPSWSMPPPRGPTTAATSTPAPAWTTWGKSTLQSNMNMTSPHSRSIGLSSSSQTMPGSWSSPQAPTSSPPSRTAGLTLPAQTVPGWSTSPLSQNARLSPTNAAARDEAEWQRRLVERARAQAEAFQREQERILQSHVNGSSLAEVAATQERIQAEETKAARLRAEKDHRIQELQSEWRQAALRHTTAQQAGLASEASHQPQDAVTGEISRLKAEIEERKRVVQEKMQAAAALHAKAEARRRDAETLMRIWEGRALAGNAIAV